jgi:protein involved in polysaccharide export with SLBB domain
MKEKIFHINRLVLRACLIFISFATSYSQSLPGQSTAGATQSQAGQSADCSDPQLAATAACSGALGQGTGGQGRTSPPEVTNPVLRTPISPFSADQYYVSPPPSNPPQLHRPRIPLRPETEFEQMVADTVGRVLPLFGQSLFEEPPSTFSPIDRTQAPAEYVIGPGDELRIRIWGQVEADLRVVVDPSGGIYIPQVGEVTVAGVRYGDLEDHIKRQVGNVFKNFNLTVEAGHLRAIQVTVVGNARYPGTYTISSLSTLVNAVFSSGGPSPQGSLRHIQVRRGEATITDFDFYDLLVNGDKSKDVRLQSGDVIYIPHVGPLVAISGSINTPAIYEMKSGSTLGELIETAGDLSTVADSSRITIDRFADRSRKTLEFPLDDQSRVLVLQDGDIVRVWSIIPRFEDTVTLRGNVANPGRYPWKPGMRVRDLIPDAQALLTRRYWRERAAIVNGRATEYPILGDEQPSIRNDKLSQDLNLSNPNAPNNNPSGAIRPEGSAATAEIAEGMQSSPNDISARTGDQSTQDKRGASSAESSTNPNTVKNVAQDIRRYSPEINWDYAIIQRINPIDLSSRLIWMSPRKAILEHDDASNLELQAGDIVTIFSQHDISVPESNRSRYVVIEGEVRRPGIYKLEVNETLHSILERAGGLTPEAYIYGSQLFRESARIVEQKSLDELARTMEVQVRQTTAAAAASSQAGEVPQMLSAQEAILGQLHSARATGRVSLPVRPHDKDINDFPDMMMEDNDRLTIPHTPSTVAVVGNVYNPGSFIYNPHNTVESYLDMAGKGKPASDFHHAFVLRANGVVVAANNVNGPFTGGQFDRLRLYPGDQVIVPYKLPTGAFVRGLRDWSQIVSQLAVTGVVLSTVLP